MTMRDWAHGVFESLRCYRREFFLLEEHLDRLFESAQSLGWRLPFSRQEILEKIQAECQTKELERAFVRVTIYRDWDQEKYEIATTIIPEKEYSAQYYREGATLAIVPTRRNSPIAVSPQIKSNNTLGGIFAYEEGRIQGAFETLLLNEEGYVTEGTTCNFFVVRKGKVITPPVYLGILAGVTRDYVMKLAAEEKIEVAQTPLTRHDVYNADEAFLTNTSMGIMPVRCVDGRMVGTIAPGELTRRLMERFQEGIREWEKEVTIDQN